ncbi:MAG: branched-chain amino acid aminotransferase [Christensenellales bacterium]
MELKLIETVNKKAKPQDESKLEFGHHFTDHMFLMEYNQTLGWHNARIEPYAPLSLEPSTLVLHYGQGIFEGLKVYKGPDGSALLFRPQDNFQRLNASARRMCMPEVDTDFVLDCLIKLVKLEQDWIPTSPDTSLYIRPTMISTDQYIGVKAATNYLFFIILSPVGPYYPGGLQPVKIYIEDHYIRAAKGGLGEAKTMANYAASLLAGEEAAKKGFTQVLWLDAAEKRYVQEVGSMNMFFKIDGKVITPPLDGTILPGITRNSVLKLCAELGMPTVERPIAIEEIFAAHSNGKLEEAFGTGTAAVISPVGELYYEDKSYVINNGQAGEFSLKLYDTLTSIQYGKRIDSHGWSTKIF